MTAIRSLDLDLIAIAAMAAATLLMRAAGFWMMGYVPLTARIRRMLQALPGSIVVAAVLPIAAKGGPVAVIAIATALAVMIARRNELLAITLGVAAAALARAAGL